jgi:hypothetical protein
MVTQKKIRLNKKIYKLKALKNAIKDYNKVVNISLRDSKDCVTISLGANNSSCGEKELEKIKDEFLNYALYLALAS